ncbi:MAG TPA: tetratricopeptide repeat protein [Sphingomicrobium sp.]|nr:tetratricopeptide repeat protein [Sphingomicrobium sp.]
MLCGSLGAAAPAGVGDAGLGEDRGFDAAEFGRAAQRRELAGRADLDQQRVALGERPVEAGEGVAVKPGLGLELGAAEPVSGRWDEMAEMGQAKSAIALLGANARDYPDKPDAAFGLGRAYATAGREAEARAEFRRALTLDPKHSRAADALKALDTPRPAPQ